jgi:hypothetical protein
MHQKNLLSLKEVHTSGLKTMKRRYIKSKLLAIAGEQRILLEVEELHIAKADLGWRRKPKGLKQVLFERGPWSL